MYVALEHLAKHGIGGFSIAAVAADAGTTRPAIYRRWSDKIDLLVAAVAWLAATDPPHLTGDPYVDLVIEAEHFRHCISDVGAISLAGVMLTNGVEEPIRDSYHERLVKPRWDRLAACFTRAAQDGLIDPETDADLAVSMLTGSWYAYVWSGRVPAQEWPRTIVDAVWRSVGGTVPSTPVPVAYHPEVLSRRRDGRPVVALRA